MQHENNEKLTELQVEMLATYRPRGVDERGLKILENSRKISNK